MIRMRDIILLGLITGGVVLLSVLHAHCDTVVVRVDTLWNPLAVPRVCDTTFDLDSIFTIKEE
jgi:hypothetical protein